MNKVAKGMATASAAIALFAATGCSDLTDTRRWASVRKINSPAADVEARVYVAPGPAVASDPSSSNPLSGWSDRAQGAFVAGMAAKTGSSKAFSDAIIKAKPSSPGGSIYTAVDVEKRLLVVALTRPAGYSPGDRIARAVVRVQPINFSLGGYTIAQTARQTYDVTALTRTAGLEEDLSAATPSTAPVTASAGIKATQGTSSVTKLTESPETLTIDMIPPCMRMVQEGAHSVDLTGNTKIAASLVTEVAPNPKECTLAPEDPGLAQKMAEVQEYFVADPGLTFKSGRPQFAAGAAGGSPRSYPKFPLIAKIDVEYVLRRVDSEARSYDESVQDVTLVRGRFVDCQVVLPLSQAIPPLYALYEPGAQGGFGPPVTVGTGERRATLAFTTYDAALKAEAWVSFSSATTFGVMPLHHTPGIRVKASRLDTGKSGGQCGDEIFYQNEMARRAALAAAHPS